MNTFKRYDHPGFKSKNEHVPHKVEFVIEGDVSLTNFVEKFMRFVMDFKKEK